MLIKKTFFLIFLTLSLFANGNVDFLQRGHQDIRMLFSDPNYLGENGQSWLGLYEADKPNGKENAVTWSLLADLQRGCCPNDSALENKRLFRLTNYMGGDNGWLYDFGHYQLRVFDEGVDTPYSSFDFWIDDINNTTLSINSSEFANGAHELNVNATYMDDKTWVGVFRENTQSNIDNLIDWKRVNSDGSVDTIDLLNYESGFYKVKLFFHDTYNQEKSRTFRVTKGDTHDRIFNSCWYAPDRHYFFVDIDTPLKNATQNKDWAGVFKYGAEHSIDNLVAWTYITDNLVLGHANIYQQDLIEDSGKYELVYFRNDSYTQYGQKYVFNIEGHANGVYISTYFHVNDHTFDFYINGITLKNKDWIAIFNEGDEFKRENILEWRYVKPEESRKHIRWKDGYEAIKHNPNNKVLVLFSNDTYEVLTKASIFCLGGW